MAGQFDFDENPLQMNVTSSTLGPIVVPPEALPQDGQRGARTDTENSHTLKFGNNSGFETD
jgi:hypothetical protein